MTTEPSSNEFAFDPRDLGSDVQRLFDGKPHALVVAPFMTKSGLLPLIEAIGDSARLDVVTRWEPLEVKAGVSDPLIIDDVEATGGTVRLLPRLHAKVYCAGECALVGSANPTGPGMGFTSQPNVELLVGVHSHHPALSKLFDLIDDFSTPVDRNFAQQVCDFAAALPDAVTPLPESPGPSLTWLPQTRVPSHVISCYLGTDRRDDYQADIDSLALPSGLNAETFHQHVAIALQQGLTGRILRECDGLQQWDGVERMRALISAAGIVRNESPPQTWETLRNWFKYFLNVSEGLNGGFIQASPAT